MSYILEILVTILLAMNAFMSGSVVPAEFVKDATTVTQPTHLNSTVLDPTRKVIRGTASWGDFGGHVVTLKPVGTRIKVVGPNGVWRGRSWGNGPRVWTGRIVDLDVHVFEDICYPRSVGLCKVKLIFWKTW